MSLEVLANELLLDLLDYFHAVEILRSFHGLNKRFDALILIYFQKHRLDFRAASKRNFDLVCQENLPLITNQIISLGLSSDDEIPQQIDLFHSYGWTLNRFQNLSSLFFSHVRSGELISDILRECPQLIHLNLTSCYFGRQQDDILCLVKCIWSLPKLIYCYLNIIVKTGFYMPTPDCVSLSLEHLSVLGVMYRIDQLASLYECTPHLRYLSLDLTSTSSVTEIRTSFSSIIDLNISFVGTEQNSLESLLQHVPNLFRLKVETMYLDMNGYEWEQIIRQYLRKLDVFQLKMRFAVRSEKDRKALFKSFQTPFWLKEHQWFIRYHYNLDDNSNMICLYTLPYSFSYLDMFFPVHFESTCPNNNELLSYNHVQHLLYRSSLTSTTIEPTLTFSNTTYLSITLPVSNHLILIIQKLHQLASLEVSRSKSMPDIDAQVQLQNILDNIPHLQLLKFNSWREFQFINHNSSMSERLTPMILKTRPISHVNLRGYDWWFNDEECIRICDSSLIKQCEVLHIKVQNRLNILHLINSLHNLRALNVQSRDDNWGWNNYSIPTDDSYVQWLQQNLPFMCSVKRDFRFVHCIRIWIQL